MSDSTEVLKGELKSAQEEIERLHAACEKRGFNSRETKDIFGRTFPLPVDAEHKATGLYVTNFSQPHMRAFHASWLGFFATFFSTFAAAPLGPYIRRVNPNMPNGISKANWADANIASVAGTIVFRFMMGTICDKFGPRRGLALLLVMTCPAIVGIAFVSGPVGFIVCRCIIGCSLASFVACQVWCSQHFSKSVIGIVNGTSGGWGNLGGGITTLVMVPVFYSAFFAATDNVDLSWRLCFIVPLVLHLASAALVMSGRDLPDGNYGELETSGAKQKGSALTATKIGWTNVNAWVLFITYGFCFGVELTMTNVAPLYFHDYHGMSPAIASVLASIFGLVNLVARSLGGITSDWANAKAGMRGRIWALWLFQSIEGALCCVMGAITMGMASPDDFPGQEGTITGWTNVWGEWYPVNGTADGFEMIGPCGASEVLLTDEMKEQLPAIFKPLSAVVITQPPSPYGGGDECISNSGTVGVVVLVVFLFSVAVQMAEGLSFGVVPYVSRPALGVVNGMVGAGGNLGAVITLSAFFKGTGMRTDVGLLYMGITIIAVTLLCLIVYFPEHGGMLFPAGGLGKYNPQLWEPAGGYRGADAMDYNNVNLENMKTSSTKELTKGSTKDLKKEEAKQSKAEQAA